MSLKIQLEKESYYSGQIVKGVLSINVIKPLKARKVQVSFEGKEHTHTERDRGYWDDGSRHIEIHEEKNILVTDTITVWKATKGENFELSSALFPFEFQIPEQILPSVVTRGKDYALIIYEIIAKIDRPLAVDPEAHCEVLILPQPYETYHTNAIERSREDPEKKMQLIVHADKDICAPGEHVTGKVIFKKDPSIWVESMVIAVVYTGSVTTQGSTVTSRMVAEDVNYEIDPQAGFYEIPFDLAIPEEAKCTVNGKLIQRLWEVEVKVNILSKGIEKVNLPILVVPQGGET